MLDSLWRFTDVNLNQFIESTINSGISKIFKDYTETNNIFLKS